nr:NADH dehydrogenase subunit 5 [Trinoton querquedulae]
MYFKSACMLMLVSLVMVCCWINLLLNTNDLVISWPFLQEGSVSLNFSLVFDCYSGGFCITVCVISSMVLLYSKDYMSSSQSKKLFGLLMVMFIMSMVVLTFSQNFVVAITGWDLLGLSSYLLIMFYSSQSSSESGLLTYITNRLGDSFMLMSFMYLTYISLSSKDGFSEAMTIVSVFLLLSAITKSAQFPFISWLPAAMAAPTPVSSLVHSSTLVTAGIYLLIRYYSFWENSEKVKLSLLLMSVCTLMIGSISAFAELDMKKIIALSTLSQLGLIFLMLSHGLLNQAYFHMLCHAFFKALLFMLSGILIHSASDNQVLSKLSVTYHKNPILGFLVFSSCMALSGFPFLSGFYSKDLFLEKIFTSNWVGFVILILLSSLGLTMAYSMRVIISLTGYSLTSPLSGSGDYGSMKMLKPCLLLFLLTCSFGSISQWCLFPKTAVVSSNLEKVSVFAVMLFLTLVYFMVKKTLLKKSSMIFSMKKMTKMTHWSVYSSMKYFLISLSLSELGWLKVFGGKTNFYLQSNLFMTLSKGKKKLLLEVFLIISVCIAIAIK